MEVEMPASGLASNAALWIRQLLLPNGFLLRRELVQDSVSHVDHFLIYRAVFGDCVRQRYGDNLIRSQSGHAAELATVHHINCAQSVARGQHAIEGAGGAAALDVSENHGACFERSGMLAFTSNGDA